MRASTASTASGDTVSATVPEAAVDLVVPFEGFSAVPYRDCVGVWTIGYGSTRTASGDPVRCDTPSISDATARLWVRHDLQEAAMAVARDVKVPLTDNQSAALDDFVYNLGAGSLGCSTLLRLLNAGDYAGAAAEFDKWDHAGGKELAGLLRRRQAETDLFLKAP